MLEDEESAQPPDGNEHGAVSPPAALLPDPLATGARPKLLLVLATCATLAPVLLAGFIWDDGTQVVDNTSLRTLSGLLEIWAEPGSQMQYYPLTYTSFWLEYQLWGPWAPGYHALSLALHVANALLVYGLARRLQLRGAFLVALLFAIHPMQVEPVAWVAERSTLLSGALSLLAAGAWLDFRASGRRAPYARAIVLFALACLAKTMAVTLPALLLLLDWWRAGRSSDSHPAFSPREAAAALLPFFLVSGGLALITVAQERAHFVGGSSHIDGFVDSVLIAGRALWSYAGKLLWPAELAAIYPRWSVSPLSPTAWLFPAAFLAALVYLYRKLPELGRGPLAGLLFFAIGLSPVLGFLDFGFLGYSYWADRYVYLACLGLFAPLAAGVGEVLERQPANPARTGVRVGVLACCIVLAHLSFQQTRIYESSHTYWTHNLAVYESDTAYATLGDLSLAAGRLEEAAHYIHLSLELRDNPEARARLGLIYMQRQQPERAIAEFRRALELTSGSGALRELRARIYFNLGAVYYNFGAQRPGIEWSRAVEYWQRAAELQPELPGLAESLEAANRRFADEHRR